MGTSHALVGEEAELPRFGPDEKRAMINQLRAARADGLTMNGRVGDAAAAAGCSARTIWRWMGEPGERRAGFALSVDDIDALVGWKGNAAAAWRERRREAAAVPSLRTFQRGRARQLTPGERAAMRTGVEGRRQHQIYLERDEQGRNLVWEADHKMLDVPVLMPSSRVPRRPWVTLVLDASTRAIMGWAICDYPSSATVLAALGAAIRMDPEAGPFGGTPTILRPDRGLEFAAQAVARACGVLGIDLRPTYPYLPQGKGKVERVNRTLVQELLCEMPGFVDGPKRADGKLYGPKGAAMTMASLVQEFDAYVRHYNATRPHQGLGGRTPLQVWSADPTPLRLITDADLRWMLMATEPRKVRGNGVRFHGINFVAPELNGRVGQKVEVRYIPHDDRRIELYFEGQWLATARPQGTLTDSERAEFMAQRHRDAVEAGRLQRRARRRARNRIAPITGPGPVEETGVVTADAAAIEERRRADTDTRGAARTDLLGLED